VQVSPSQDMSTHSVLAPTSAHHEHYRMLSTWMDALWDGVTPKYRHAEDRAHRVTTDATCLDTGTTGWCVSHGAHL
jgi:hypothetical protein